MSPNLHVLHLFGYAEVAAIMQEYTKKELCETSICLFKSSGGDEHLGHLTTSFEHCKFQDE